MSDSTDQLTDLTSSKSKDNNEEPVSRFWACFFSCSILALLWTQKMNKTVKWIPVFIIFVTIWYVIDNILYPIPLEINTVSNLIDFFFFYPESNMKPLEILVDDIVLIVVDMELMPTSYSKELVSILSYTIIVFYNLVAYFGSILLMIYLMFKWTTQYNIKHFGYKSKKEWKKTINNKYNTQQIMKKELKIIGNEIVGSIIKTTKKLKPQTKTGDDEVIAKINKWHKLMEKGILSESEFESKKSELLDKSQK